MNGAQAFYGKIGGFIFDKTWTQTYNILNKRAVGQRISDRRQIGFTKSSASSGQDEGATFCVQCRLQELQRRKS